VCYGMTVTVVCYDITNIHICDEIVSCVVSLALLWSGDGLSAGMVRMNLAASRTGSKVDKESC